jgi:hypothetical protein
MLPNDRLGQTSSALIERKIPHEDRTAMHGYAATREAAMAAFAKSSRRE